MIKKVLVVVLMVVVWNSYAQEGTASPYSFYGIGTPKFKGTIENRSMGGLSILADSVHINLRNPAAYGHLKLTAYGLGASYSTTNITNESTSSAARNGSLDYLAIGIPAGKFGFGFGLLPATSVGYKVSQVEVDTETRFTGSGGMNKVYLSAGLKLNENLSLGLDFNYNFGRIENKVILQSADTQFDTREINESSLSGVSFAFGINYKQMITEKLELTATFVSAPSFNLSSENARELATILVRNGAEEAVQSQDITISDSTLELPAELRFGVGLGQPKKWFVGTEYTYLSANNFTERFFTPDNVSYVNASQMRLGGYYIPKYNSLTSYFKRVVYRAGFRYEQSGLNINSTSIDEFGISFGVGLPIGTMFSNANLGFEYGQRGTTDFGLIKEDFFSFSIGLSLNDKWFRKIKFN